MPDLFGSPSPRVAILAGSLMLLAGPSAADSRGDRLGALKDKARPLVIVSDARDDLRIAKQMSALDHAKRGLRDRDIVILREAKTGGVLRRFLGLPERGFAVVLVGKDGTVKDVWRKPVDPEEIFTIIDAMPMRQREMKG